MTEAHSINPSTFTSYISKVSDPAPGDVVVHTYSAGVDALRAGKRVQYIGASGPVIYDRWHNIATAFQVARWSGTAYGTTKVISDAELTRLMAG